MMSFAFENFKALVSRFIATYYVRIKSICAKKSF